MPGKTRFCPTCRFMSLETPHANAGMVMICRLNPPQPVPIAALMQVPPSVRHPNGEMQIRTNLTVMAVPVNAQQWCHRHEPLPVENN